MTSSKTWRIFRYFLLKLSLRSFSYKRSTMEKLDLQLFPFSMILSKWRWTPLHIQYSKVFSIHMFIGFWWNLAKSCIIWNLMFWHISDIREACQGWRTVLIKYGIQNAPEWRSEGREAVIAGRKIIGSPDFSGIGSYKFSPMRPSVRAWIG